MGSRMRGKIHPGAMPPLHRFLGNPVLTWILNLFFSAGISDAHCGMRGFSREAILRLDLRTDGMELASEMIVRAAQEGLRIDEVPTSLRPDGRDRPPHLQTWRDGWRHLRFLLLFSPLWLFLVPGLAMASLGLLLTIVVATRGVTLFGHTLDTHFALLGSVLAIVGTQLCTLGLYAKAVFVLDGIGKSPGISRLLRAFQLEAALCAGGLLVLAGLGIDAFILHGWLATNEGDLDRAVTHLAILGGTLAALGVEVVFAAFFLSILQASRARKWV